MKKNITLIIALTFTLFSYSQAPKKMSYQAVIRDASNSILDSKPVSTRISILQGSATGSVVYSETHNSNTNQNGLISVEIGSGTVVSGTYTSIKWYNGPYFIKTETGPAGGTNYNLVVTRDLLSVPY